MKKLVVSVLSNIILTVFILAGNVAAGEIYGCYGKIGGLLRIVDGPNKCTKLEKPIFWNSIGIQGPAGPRVFRVHKALKEFKE